MNENIIKLEISQEEACYLLAAIEYLVAESEITNRQRLIYDVLQQKVTNLLD